MKTVSSKISILIKYGETFIQQEMGRYFRLKTVSSQKLAHN